MDQQKSAVLVAAMPRNARRTRALLGHAGALLCGDGWHVTAIDLANLPADGLLGRTDDPEVLAARYMLRRAGLAVFATPLGPAGASGLLRVFLDRLDRDELRGRRTCVLATGREASEGRALSRDLIPWLHGQGAVLAGALFVREEECAVAGAPALDARLREMLLLTTAPPPVLFS